MTSQDLPSRNTTSPSSGRGICLVAEADAAPAWIARVDAVLAATDAATLILTPPANGKFEATNTRPLIETAQARGVAVLLADDVASVKAIGADGVHLSWRPEIEDAYEAARSALGPDVIVGVDAGISRHDAMTVGEAGADYVAFGRAHDLAEPAGVQDTQRDLVSWWSDVFVVPVVAFDAETPADVSDLIRNGADFVAVRVPKSPAAADDATWAAALVSALTHPVEAA